jgi:hypothetical protein
MNYSCWTVTCKNTECGGPLLLDVIGPADKFRHTMVPFFHPFTTACPLCKMSHSYGPVDLIELVFPDPPTDRPCKPFLEALRKASKPPT